MIYVITHKIFNDEWLDRTNYTILHVGSNNNMKSSYIRDDTGDNISEKNQHYCELTGQYWVWKNVNESPDQITGILHYRRYFTTRRGDLLYTYFHVPPRILEMDTVRSSLNRYDMILPSRVKICRTLEQFYAALHDAEDLKYTREIINRITPEYLKAFDKTMKAHYYYYGNMFICSRKLFEQYSEWLYSILFPLEAYIDLDKAGDTYQARVMGFLSERLLQVWVLHNHISVKEFPVYNTEVRRMTKFQQNKNRIIRAGKILMKQ